MVSAPSKLPSKPSGQTSATLSDGKVTYNFLLDPQTLSWSSQADYSNNSVLLTDKPDVTWKSSVSSLSVPNILFVSQGMTQDISVAIKQLAVWCSSGATLKFAFGATVIPRCHIARFTHTEKQWRSGKCTQAEGNLDFLISREPVPVVTVDPKTAPKFPTATIGDVRADQKTSPEGTKKPKVPKRTDRELLKIKQEILADLKNPAKRQALGITLVNPTVFVVQQETDRDAVVSIRDSKGTELYSGFYFVYKQRLGKK